MSSGQPPEPEMLADDLRYHVEEAGLQISTPHDWSSGIGFDGELVVFSPPHPPDSPFISTFTVITHPRAADDEPGSEVADQAQALMQLDDAILLESGPSAVGGRPAAWALVAYNNGEYELTLEQWVIATDSRIVVLSATVVTADYAYDAQLYEDVVDTVAFDG